MTPTTRPAAGGSGTTAEHKTLLRLIDEAYERKSWHGPNLRGSLRGVTVARASWRPARERHNIWEIVVHAAYWKYTVRRRLRGEQRGSFPLAGSNWFERPASGADEAAWRRDLTLLDEVHRTMRQAIAELPASHLDVVPASSKVSHADLIRGIALHDVYHAGQIQLLKRLSEQA